MRPQHILVDANTKRVLTTTPLQAVAIHLQRITPQTWWFPDAQFPNYQSSFPLESLDPTKIPAWMWDAEKRLLSEDVHEVPNEIATRAALASVKRGVLTRIVLVLSTMRAEFDTGVAFQETVYAEKARQARLVASGEADAVQAPYVQQHAAMTGLSLAQAAKDILFAAKLSHETFLRTEALRMKYFLRLRDVATPDETQQLLKEFLREARPDSLS